ncbi:MAG TPA: WecB/TagA/CpsF family glycosyltransferase [Gemmataceae bacterium]|jgi:N-acetylglucosaminyldiphosphoundecaprenol N-acetyl-beta-D-mannosaminyltransferase|nr:WecB/TagA/CpsF family glycosyltransferase [Gemmataceae bacterium]
MPSSADDIVWVWGLPLVPDSFERALDRIDRLIVQRTPSFFITANLNYAMLTDADPRIRTLNQQAAFILADGMPLVWWSRLGGRPLPERVAGSDLIYGMCDRAMRRGHRIYLLGAAPGVADEAAAKLRSKYPGINIVGVECPPFRKLSVDEERQQIARIRTAQPDILFVAFGQPKGEFWIAEHLDQLAVPVCVQVGATLDFVAGRVRRSPRWMQKTGLEWVYRLLQEPRRLTKRYLDNIAFLIRTVFAPRFRKERLRAC